MFGLGTAKKSAVVGLDIRDNIIYAVAVSAAGKDDPQVILHVSEPVEMPGSRDAQLGALRKLVTEYDLKGWSTVISTTTPTENGTIVGTFGQKVPKGRGIDLRLWALTQVEERISGGTQGNFVAEAAVSRVEGERIIAYAKRADIEARVSLAREAGLKVIAFDSPLTSWERSYGHYGLNYDGVFDIDGKPTLYLFKEPVGYVRSFGDMTGETLASAVRTYINEIRKNDRDVTIKRIALHGPGDQTRFAATLTSTVRIDFEQHTIDTDEGRVDPPWAFAAAVALWDTPVALGTRVNLLNADRRGYAAFGRTFSREDLVPGAAALAAAAVVVIGGELGYSSVIANVQDQDNVVSAQVLAANARAAHIAQIQTGVEKMREIDRDRFWLDRSGRIVALRLVDLANAVPRNATIDRLVHDSKVGWKISGASSALDPVAQTQDALAKASPGENVTMIHEGQTGKIYSFDMMIASPKLVASPMRSGTNVTATLGDASNTNGATH
jgi:hypothetical protein